jgi:hypothetical protein
MAHLRIYEIKMPPPKFRQVAYMKNLAAASLRSSDSFAGAKVRRVLWLSYYAGSHPAFNLARHGYEGFLYICGIFSRSLDKLNAERVSELLYFPCKIK